uniref:Gypsy retrotransposon integrase-like protein 1 n=1 Tax=Leptobrachium leishanense TaxID=445787 RepID=A0A8C5M421_9ANUR
MGTLTQSLQEVQSTQAQFQSQLHDLQAGRPGPSPPLPWSFFASSAPSGGEVHTPEPEVPMPDRFNGDRKLFQDFITSCLLYFSLKPRTYTNDHVRIQMVITLLTGEARTWAHTLIHAQDPTLNSWLSFLASMETMFGDPFKTDTAQTAIRALRQGRHPVEEYVTSFRKYALDTAWNEAALVDQFRRGLADHIKDEIARGDRPRILEEIILLSISVDRRWRERQLEKNINPYPSLLPQTRRMGSNTPRPLALPPVSSSPLASSEEPMQVGLIRGHLPPAELERRRKENCCLYCGRLGHVARTCPEKIRPRGKPLCHVQLPRSPSESTYLLSFDIVLQWEDKKIPLRAMIDSGASNCILDSSLAHRVCVPVHNKEYPIKIQVVDGSSLSSGVVTHETLPIQVWAGPRHQETLSFDLIPSPMFPVILGIPWLRQHDPMIQWSTGLISFPSPYCNQNCLNSPPTLSVNTVLDTNMRKTGVQLPTCYQEYKDVFDEIGVETLPPHRKYDCPIDLLPGAAIPFGRIYPLSTPELEVLKTYIKENLQKGFIRPSTSPAGAGIFFIGKKDGGLRPCVDFRELNHITIKNRYPLPLIPELMERLQTATVFSKIDLRGAYNLVRIREGDEWKTAFRTRYGHFEYVVMPYGLCNAPGTFQHLVNDVFRDLLDRFVIIYLDDILIYSPTLEEHQRNVEEVLSRLRNHQLYAKLDKCSFNQSRISFLGYILSPGKLEMDPEKVAAIHSWPTPTNKKEVQRFLGFSNFYRKFIRNFSHIVQPLTRLTKNHEKFRWAEDTQKAFLKLKDLFTSAPILEQPDPNHPYFLEVDASENATGAILSQRNLTSGNLHPIAFYSKRLNPAETRYDVGDKELLAIKRGFDEWRHLLEGSLYPITVYTDHQNLEHIKTAKRLRPRQARWALFFTRFNFHITYRPGSRNGKADALSRCYSVDSTIETSPPTILQQKHFTTVQSTLLSRLKKDSKGQSSNKQCLLVSPNNLMEVLKNVHDSPLAGHGGIRKTLHRTRQLYHWPSLKKDVTEYIRSCPECNRMKSPKCKPVGLLQPLPTASTPWRDLSIDFIVDLPPSQGNTAIMVVVDRFSKMAHFLPIPGLPTANETASLFLKEIVRLHGVPSSIVSDRGVQFTSKVWSAFCQSLNIKIHLSSSHHPQTNGQTERVNQQLEQYLRCYSSYQQDNWSDLLPTAEFAYNSQTHDSIHKPRSLLTTDSIPLRFQIRQLQVPSRRLINDSDTCKIVVNNFLWH